MTAPTNIRNTKSVLNVSSRIFSQNFNQKNPLNVNIYLLLVEKLGNTYFCMHQDGFPENRTFVTHFLPYCAVPILPFVKLCEGSHEATLML